MHYQTSYLLLPGLLRGLVSVAFLSLFQFTAVGQVSVQVTSGMTTDIKGLVGLTLTGDWDNEGMLLPGMSTFRLEGPFVQNIGQVSGDFYRIEVDKGSGDLVLNSDIMIAQGNITVWNGDVQLNGFQIVLDPEAKLMETVGNTVQGNAGVIRTERPLAMPNDNNIAGMGLGIESSEDLGVCMLARGHAPQAANGVEGIHRYFDLIPANPGSENAVLYLHYDVSELNGNTEESLGLYRSDDGGLNWTGLEGTLDTDMNTLQFSDIPSGARYTLSSYCLETCVATEARGKAIDLNLNAAGLAVVLPGQVDDGTTGACGIDSLYVVPDAFDCSLIGSQQAELIVLDQNGCTKTTVVDIVVHDSIAPEMHCNDITLEVGNTCQVFLQPGDIDDGSYDACGLTLSVDLTEFTCDDIGVNTVVLTGEDPSGNIAQCVVSVTVISSIPDLVCNDIAIQLNNETEITIDPLLLFNGDPGSYPGFIFTAEPPVVTCADLGTTEVMLLATDELGNELTCSSTVTLLGPDADCDGVADQCDVCEGGDDRVDIDGDGTPDCADWDGYTMLPPDWQCPNGNSNKVFICHNGNVICVNENAVEDHLDHGDFLGSCIASECDPGNAVVLRPGDVNGQMDENIVQENEDAVGSRNIDSGRDIMLEAVPNPFISETSIRFYLDKQSNVDLSVYSLLGSRVGKWESTVLLPGWHTRKYDASDLGPGVYVIRLQAGTKVLVCQMVQL